MTNWGYYALHEDGISCPVLVTKIISVEKFVMSMPLQITRFQSTKLYRVEEL